MKHINLKNTKESIDFKSPNSGGGSKDFYPNRQDKLSHIQRLQHKFNEVINDNEVKSFEERETLYLQITGEPGARLKYDSLENRIIESKVLKIREIPIENIDGEIIKVEQAVLSLPKKNSSKFLKKLEEYEATLEEEGKPKNNDLVRSISNIEKVIVESFWTGEIEWMPEDSKKKWCEVWIDSVDDNSIKEFEELVKALNIQMKEEQIIFEERTVFIAKVSKNDLSNLVKQSDHIAEFRKSVEVKPFFIELDVEDQQKFAKELLSRIELEDKNVYVSLLDTGINSGHPLLEQICSDEDIHSYFDNYDGFDVKGHGTNMSGVIVYGYLEKLLESLERIVIPHRIESVKVLPDSGENDEELYGAIVQESVSDLTIENPDRIRVYCMAITANDYSLTDGRPSSWSGALDELISGRFDEDRKVFFVAGGNIDGPFDKDKYPELNIETGISEPAQSWNAITVGAYVNTEDKEKENIATFGQLSPFSRTSRKWDNNRWPIKPEIVFDGGTAVLSEDKAFQDDTTSILTTHHKVTNRLFDTIWATSAATAFATNMAAKIRSVYPESWPETIRGLMVHSAEWTPEMKSQFLKTNNKSDFTKLLRTCGYGVPDYDRAITTNQSRVAMIIEDEIQPFDGDETKEMHLHKIPWPTDLLLSDELEDVKLKMKITLSYFIEPSPGEIGWRDKFLYQSHGLRFALNGNADKDDFAKKINRSARNTKEDTGESSGIKWTLGKNNQIMGSIHSDIWEDFASQMATQRYVAIYPVNGWWRKRKHLGFSKKKAKYSLILTVESEKENVDLLTPILNEIEQTVEIENIIES